MTAPRAPVDEPWYRNGWVWLVIGIPAATVAGCLVTIWLAVTNPDERVREPAPAASERELPP
jgi:hypothetical protein